MIHKNESIASSQECVEQNANLQPTAVHQRTDQRYRQKRIQDTNDEVTKKDTGGMPKEDTLLPTKKVRWKNLGKENETSIKAR